MSNTIESAIAAIKSCYPVMKVLRKIENGDEIEVNMEGEFQDRYTCGPPIHIHMKYDPSTEILKFKGHVGCFGWDDFVAWTENPDLVEGDVMDFGNGGFERNLPLMLGEAALDDLKKYHSKCRGF
jgi:hypothetical protein